MTPTTIHIVCGPQGCGKTRNAERMKEYFNADTVTDLPAPTPKALKRVILSVARSKPQTVVYLTHLDFNQLSAAVSALSKDENKHELMAGVTVDMNHFGSLMMAMADYGIPEVGDQPEVEDLPKPVIKGPSYLQPTTREEAQALVEQLRKDFDLIDDAAMLRDMIEQMEARNEESFNAFFETILARFLEATGQTEVTFDTAHMIAEMFAPSRLEVESAPGQLTYRLREEETDD